VSSFWGAVHILLFNNNSEGLQSLFGAVPLVVGIATMATTLFYGPLRAIARSVADVGVLNTTLIGYIHTVLQISHTFEYMYLTQKMNLDNVEATNKLVETATEATTRKFFALIDRKEAELK